MSPLLSHNAPPFIKLGHHKIDLSSCLLPIHLLLLLPRRLLCALLGYPNSVVDSVLVTPDALLIIAQPLDVVTLDLLDLGLLALFSAAAESARDDDLLMT